MDKVILCIDPAFRNTGWSLFQGEELLSAGLVQTFNKKVKPGHVCEDRVNDTIKIALEVNKIFQDARFTTNNRGGIEQVWGEYPGGSQQAVVASMAGLIVGMWIQKTVDEGIEPIIWVTPRQVKLHGTGILNATKHQVMAFVRSTYPNYHCFPDKSGEFEHIADSIAVFHAVRNLRLDK